jgi:heterodisulfide reductase subunit A-like polyferredoxin
LTYSLREPTLRIAQGKQGASLQTFFGGFLKEKKGALVIGGGVAGIQAALDLADSDYQVYLVERSPTLGGRMAQLDKTFPTMDCAI